jgi:tetratricopeptide (TPR) repeat protein
VPGETAVCKACGAKTVVPDDARLIEYTPPLTPRDKEPTTPPDAANAPNHCPVCEHPATPIPRCVVCGYEPAAVRLYNPKHFPILAALFSGLIPLWMAAANWKRLGREDLRRRALGYGILGYMAVFAGLFLLAGFVTMSKTAEGLLRTGMHGLVNLPVGLYLRKQQLAAYAASRSLGAPAAPAWKGILGGLGILAGVVAITLTASVSIVRQDFDRGLALLKRGDYPGAASAFERALERDPTDHDSRFNAGIAEAAAGRLERSVPYLEEYLRHRAGDAKAWAILGLVHREMGHPEAADSCRAIAAKLDPKLHIDSQ